MFVLETQVQGIRVLALGASGQLLGVLGARGPASLWDLPTCKHTGSLGRAEETYHFALAFSPTDLTAVTGHWPKTVKLWSLETRRELAACTLPLKMAGYVGPLAYTADGNHLVLTMASDVGRGAKLAIYRWDLTMREAGSCGKCYVPRLGDLSLAASEQVLLANGNRLGGVTICSPGKRNVKVALPEHRAFAKVSFSPDGRTLAILRARTVRLWDVSTRQVRASWKETRLINAMAFSPGGDILATGGNDGTVKFRDVATGKERASFDWQVGTVTALTFSSDGMLAAVGGDNGKVVVWDVDQS
jgi:WD40 repeat protein